MKIKIILTIITVNLLITLVFSIQDMSQFLSNWFLVSLAVLALVAFRSLYEHGAYDSAAYSWHKVRSTFSGKEDAVNRLANDEQSKEFTNIADYIEYRKDKRSKLTPIFLYGAILSFVLSILFLLI